MFQIEAKFEEKNPLVFRPNLCQELSQDYKLSLNTVLIKRDLKSMQSCIYDYYSI